MPNFTPTTNANAIPTVIAQEMIRLLPGYMGLARVVSRDTDWTGQDFATYGDTLDIVKPGTLTVKTKTAGTAMEDQAPTADKVQVSLDQHKYISILEEDVTKMLQKPNLQQQYARNAAIKIAENIETYLFALHPSLTYTEQWDDSDATSIENSMLAIRSRFARNKVPQNQPKFAFLDTSIIDELLTIDKYSSGDYVDSNNLEEGALRRIYGINIFESQLVPTSGSPVAYHNMALTEFGLVLVNRPMPMDGNGRGVRQSIMTDPNTGLSFRLTEGYSHGDLGMRFSIDVLYGAAIADAEQVVEIESY